VNTASISPLIAPTADPAVLQQLIEFGFPEVRARKALLLNRMNLERAMEWLLEHSDDPDIDVPLTNAQLSQIIRVESSFVADPVISSALIDMGFAADDVAQALRATNNNYEAACAWLLGDRVDPTPEDIAHIVESNPLVHAILSNPIVQAGMTNPRVMHALRLLVEDPASATQFLADPEVGPVLMQVHNIVNAPQPNSQL